MKPLCSRFSNIVVISSIYPSNWRSQKAKKPCLNPEKPVMMTLNTLKSSSSLLLLLLSFSTHHCHNLHHPLPHFSITTPPKSRLIHTQKPFKYFCTATPKPDVSSPKEEKKEGQIDLAKIKEAANTLDIRVGKILKAWRHEEADSLYVEQVDVGEAEPRTICSGLVKYVPLEHLQDKNVVVLANLKPRNMRGVKSNGMLMAASDESHENVELLVPPEGSVPGERIWFGSIDEKETLPDTASPNAIQKKKIWELVQPHLRTDDSCIAALGTETMVTTFGAVSSKALKNARIS